MAAEPKTILIVLFSLLGQGLTIPILLRRLGLVQRETIPSSE